MVWFYTLISVFIVSLISLVGIITIPVKIEKLKQIVFILVSFATGALLGDAFIHLIPEVAETTGFTLQVSLAFLAGILIFFTLEKFIHWRHCHVPTSKNHPHPVVFMNIMGDGLHNLIDGMVIAGSYLISIPVGIATTLAVILHEVPQEIGDFGVLIHGGFTKAKALLFNFLSAITAIIGALIILISSTNITTITSFLIPFTAGGFIYIAGSDLIPELHKENNLKRSVIQFIGILLGIAVMVVLISLE